MAADHNCHDCREMRQATEAKPYHYSGSGLSNVYLVGVQYHVCRECGATAADIPALPELLTAIARALVKKETSLNGEELRFLRKRLKIAAAEFAQVLGVAPETLSRMENGHTQIQPNVDKLVRFVYVGLAHDRFVNLESIARWNAELHKVGGGDRIIAIRDANDQWIAEAA